MNEQKEREKEMKTVTRRIVETEGGDGRAGGRVILNGIQKDVIFLYSM